MLQPDWTPERSRSPAICGTAADIVCCAVIQPPQKPFSPDGRIEAGSDGHRSTLRTFVRS